MATDNWQPRYKKWRHGGWYVTNVRYPSGASGCVSRNFSDRKWRIVCQGTGPGAPNDVTYASRDDAARAELAIAQGKVTGGTTPTNFDRRSQLGPEKRNVVDESRWLRSWKSLHEALQKTRTAHPTATEIDLASSDQSYYGFTITGLRAGAVAIEPAGEVVDEVNDLLSDIDWNSVVGESSEGYRTLPLATRSLFVVYRGEHNLPSSLEIQSSTTDEPLAMEQFDELAAAGEWGRLLELTVPADWDDMFIVRHASEVRLHPQSSHGISVHADNTRPDANAVVARIHQAIEDGMVVTCSDCSTELPDDEPCEVGEDGVHAPDQVLTEPGEGEPTTRQIRTAFTLTVPNDRYDYSSDVTGRLAHLLTLMLLHPLVSGGETGGATGSGWVEDVNPPVKDPYAHLDDPAEREWLTNVSPSEVLKNAHRIYDLLREAGLSPDSVIRELAFDKAAEALGISYDVLYDAWLNETPVKTEGS